MNAKLLLISLTNLVFRAESLAHDLKNKQGELADYNMVMSTIQLAK